MIQGKSFEELKKILGKDLVKLKRYFDKWHLTLNASKTVATTFHLNNREARSLQLIVNNTVITNDEYPLYLGIKLDRTLTYK